ncbi:hypothetical protein COCNU_contig69173743G000010 [Cocos nucifera]|nr:hypothetical protein [Cocos nucifera]
MDQRRGEREVRKNAAISSISSLQCFQLMLHSRHTTIDGKESWNSRCWSHIIFTVKETKD